MMRRELHFNRRLDQSPFDTSIFRCSLIASHGRRSDTSSPSQTIADRYLPGLAVTVHVNHDNPTQSVLEPGDDSVSFNIAFAVGAALLASGLIGLLYGLSQ
jgi:hypothetical protein